MMKAWPEEILHMIYDLLWTLREDHTVPDWWRHRWLIPLPKRPEAPSLHKLRPIVLLVVMRKC